MKNAMWEYIIPSESEKEELWESSVFVFDTNVLLNLYRYTAKTRDNLLTAFSDLQERVWLPNQVVQEFAQNRLEVIYEMLEKYNNLNMQREKFINLYREELRLQSGDEEIIKLDEQISGWIDNQKKRNVIVSNVSNDLIFDKLLQIFDNRVGKEYTQEELAIIKEEGKNRYEKNIPPGYKDAKKQIDDFDNNAYGDLIVWKQIMDYSQKEKKNIIFITHDQKKDWWQIIKGKTIGPRIELKKEFKENTKMGFYMYSMDGFIQYFAKFKGNQADVTVVDEVRAISKKRKKKKARNLNEYTLVLERNIVSLSERISRRQRSIANIETKYKESTMPSEVKEQLYNTKMKMESLIIQREKKEEELMKVRNQMVHNVFVDF